MAQTLSPSFSPPSSLTRQLAHWPIGIRMGRRSPNQKRRRGTNVPVSEVESLLSSLPHSSRTAQIMGHWPQGFHSRESIFLEPMIFFDECKPSAVAKALPFNQGPKRGSDFCTD